MADPHSSPPAAPPLAPGLLPNLRFDVAAGFLVFLIAMPLCLGIATASQYPPIAGVWTAVIGGVLACLLSNSQLTVKGPAAGLIVVVSGAVLDLGAEAYPALPGVEVARMKAEGKSDKDVKLALTERQVRHGYPLALAVGATAGVVQILFGLLKAGKLGEMVPLTPVHGMLAAIGITIMAKMSFTLVGLPAPPGAAIDAILAEPSAVRDMVPPVAAVGLTSLAVLIAFPFVKKAVPALKAVPGQVVALAVAVPLGLALSVKGLGAAAGNPMKYLVNVPDLIPAAFDDPGLAFARPQFEAVATATGVKYVALFALVASVESMLSTQAVDLIDPWRRKTDPDRDLLAVGVANTICAAVGALPMISEIVRSKANIDSGARTRYANLFHGLFLLAFVLLLPAVIRTIPTAALAAMLAFTGFRLASPREFVHTYKLGAEQLVVFVATIVVTLCTDLLTGVASGVVLKMLIHLVNGVPVRNLFLCRSDIEVASTGSNERVVLAVKNAAVFTNWPGLRKAVVTEGEGRGEVVLDLSATRLVDHSTMEKLHELQREFADRGKRLTVAGLEDHVPLSAHPLSARKGGRAATAPPQSPVEVG